MSDYVGAASTAANAISELAKNMTLGKFVKWAFVLVLFGALCFYLYENFFTSSYYNKLDREIKIVEQVQKLGSNDSVILKKVDEKLLSIINNIEPPKINTKFLTFNVRFSKSFWEVIAILLSVTILPIIVLIQNWQKKTDNPFDNNTAIITGAVMLALFSALIALLIPIFYNAWLNLIFMPIAQLLCLMPFVYASTRNKRH